VTLLPEYRRLFVGGMPFQRPAVLPSPADGAAPMPIFLMLPQLRHPDTIRRGGAAGTIRNCLRDIEAHPRLIAMAAFGIETDLFAALAEPLIGLGAAPLPVLPSLHACLHILVALARRSSTTVCFSFIPLPPPLPPSSIP